MRGRTMSLQDDEGVGKGACVEGGVGGDEGVRGDVPLNQDHGERYDQVQLPAYPFLR